MKRLFLFFLFLFSVHTVCAQVVEESVVDGFATQIETPRWPRGYQEIGRINLGVLPESVVFSPDGTLLSVITLEGVNFYSVNGKKLGSQELKATSPMPAFSSSTSVGFTTDNSSFFSLKNGLLHIYRANVSDKSVEVLPLWSRENVASAAFSLDSSNLLYCEKKNNTFFLTLVSLEDQKVIWSRELGHSPAIQLVTPPDSSFGGVICAIPDRKYKGPEYDIKHYPVIVARWNPNTGGTLSSIGVSDYSPYKIKLSRDFKTLMYSAGLNMKVVDVETSSTLDRIEDRTHISSISGDGQMFFYSRALYQVLDYPKSGVWLNYYITSAMDSAAEGALWCVAAMEDYNYSTRRSRCVIQIWQHVP